MGRKKLIHYHSSDVNVKPHGLSLGEIGVVHVSSNPGKSLLYVETVSGSSNANTLAVFATKSYIDSATTNTLGFIGSLADIQKTQKLNHVLLLLMAKNSQFKNYLIKCLLMLNTKTL